MEEFMLAVSKGSVGSCRSLLLTPCLSLFLTYPAWGQRAILASDRGDIARVVATTPVKPGGVCVFPTPTPANIVAVPVPDFGLGIENTLTIPPLQGFVVATGTPSRRTAEVFVFHSFQIDDTWDTATDWDRNNGMITPATRTVLEGQITGTVDVRGFLHLAGIGQAMAEVLVEVIDRTDPAQDLVVSSKTLSKHELISALRSSVAYDLSVEGGGNYLGGGFDIGAGGEVRFELEKITDMVNFSLDVSLRRGHRYEVRIRNRIESRVTAAGSGLGWVGGRAAAVFFPMGTNTSVPNLVANQAAALAQLNNPFATAYPPIAPVTASLVRTGTTDPGWTADNRQWHELVLSRTGLDLGPPAAATIPAVRQLFGLPALAGQTVSALVNTYFNLGNQSLTEETIEQIGPPGVTVSRLMLSVEQDRIELAERQQIEESLERCRANLDHILPNDSGGKLEKVFLLVSERIHDAMLAGLPMNRIQQAVKKYNKALQAESMGLFMKAHNLLCESYDRLVASDDDHGHGHGDDDDDH
jgi:hypothetical protein